MNIACLCFDFSAVAAACAGTVATNDSWGEQSAVCAEHPMVVGAHYVEMTLLEKGSFGAWMGVVGQGFDAAGGGEANESAEGWLLHTVSGRLLHAGMLINWEGMPQEEEIKQGDVVGLLLDVGQRTLSVYLNGARRGVMVAPGMKFRSGQAVAALAGPLRWAVDVRDGASVRIERKAAPGPVPSTEEVAAACARCAPRGRDPHPPPTAADPPAAPPPCRSRPSSPAPPSRRAARR